MALAALNTQAENVINTVAQLATSVNHGVQGWLQHSDITWISTAVAFYGVRFARENNWNYGVEEVNAAKFVAIACSLYSVALGVFETRQSVEIEKLKNKGLIAVTNAAALSLYAATLLKINLTAVQAAVVTTAIYYAVKMGHNTLAPTSTKV